MIPSGVLSGYELEVSSGMAAKIVQGVAGIVGVVVFARALGPSGLGAYYLLLAVARLASRPIAGVGVAAKKHAADDRTPSGEVFAVMLAAGGALAAVMSATALLAEGILSSYVSVGDAGLLFVVVIFGFWLWISVDRLVEGEQEVARQMWIDSLRSVVTLALQLVFLLHFGLGVAGLVLGLVVATALTAPLSWIIVRVVPERPSRRTVGMMASYSRHSVPGEVVGLGFDRVDQLLLGAMFGPAAVGLYEVSEKLTTPAEYLGGVAAKTAMPDISAASGVGDGVGGEIEAGLRLSALIALPIFAGSVIVGEQLLVVTYGSEYAAAFPFLVALAFIRVLKSQSGIFFAALKGMGMPDRTFRITSVSLAVNLVVGVLLGWIIGVVGIVAASAVACAVRYVYARQSVAECVDASLLHGWTRVQAGASGLMGAVLVPVVFLASPTGAIEVGAVVAAGGVVYLAALAIYWEFDVS
jgi:O-antigen/teichoic acid export membrane protein